VSFVPLRVRSHFSLLWGTASPARLAERASRLGYRALALTDRDSMAGAVVFLEAARAAGVRPLLGAEITAADEDRSAVPALLLLARDRDGYATLCRVVSERRLEPAFDPVASLAASAAGVHVVCGEPALATRLREVVPPGSLWLDLPPEGRRAVPPTELAAAARRLDVGLLATGGVSLGGVEDHELHRVLRAAAARDLVARFDPARGATPDEVLVAPRDAARAWRGFPDALANARRVAASCAVELHRGTPIFPVTPLPPNRDALAHLRAQCEKGIRRRLRDPELLRETRARLRRELDVIARLGFVEYFVIVGDIVRAARARGIPTVGRGSGASSVVSWALGITNVNPVRYDLTFERFLHDRRADCPDLDVDLCWRGRDEVIEHVYRTYGRDRVAMISTHVLFHPRSAFREVARACGLPPARVDRMSKLLPRTWDDDGLRDRLRHDPVARRGVPLDDPTVAHALALAERLLGAPRHLGIHSGGIVIGDRPLTAYTALERATKGIVVTQLEMRAIEKIGLVKIDLLGNRALSTVRETVALVERGRGEHIDLDAVPDGCPEAARRLRAGDTLGAFQIESPGMRNLLRQLRPTTLDGVIAALSLIRPGPAGSGMKDLYVLRARGREPETYADGRLRRVLHANRGILLYEEDVMRVATAATGMPLSDADGLRRAIGRAREPAEWEALERWFVAKAVAHGVEPAAATAIWSDLARFGAYAFCKAHAAGYGVLAYWTVVLKARYPAEFAVAILNNHQGMYPKRVHLEDARRHGVRILRPSVGRSAEEFTLEDGAVRVGLGEIAGLSRRAIESTVGARDRRPFTSLGDFLRRTRLARPEAEAIVKCGAADDFGETRPRLLWRLRATFGDETARRAGDEPALFDPERFRRVPPSPDLADYDPLRRAEMERELLGFPVDGHPMRFWRDALRLRGVVPAAALPPHAGRRALVAGLASAHRRFATARGGTMQFLTLEDETGLAETTLFPDAYRRFAGLVRGGGMLLAAGRVEDHLGAITLTMDRLERLPAGPPRPRGAGPRVGHGSSLVGHTR
jgi:DNA-directed DNA polymerase III PolC